MTLWGDSYGAPRPPDEEDNTVLEISGVTWAVTIGVIVALLALDLTLAALRPHRVGFREATAWSVFYIAVALVFGVWMWWAHGSEYGTEYLAGYIVELVSSGHLQRLGVIQYSRGRITVIDRPQLERLCCECYGVVKQETDRLQAL